MPSAVTNRNCNQLQIVFTIQYLIDKQPGYLLHVKIWGKGEIFNGQTVEMKNLI